MTTATATAADFDPALIRALRAAPWRTIEKRFLVVLAASFAAHVGFAAYIAAQPAPKFEGFEEAAERGYHPQRLPPLLKIPNIPNLPIKAGPSTAARPSAQAAPKSVGEQRAVAKGAIDRMFGSGAVVEVLGAPGNEFAQAMEGVQGQQVYGNVGLTGPKGPATGQAETVGPIGTEGVKAVHLGTRVDKQPLQTKSGPIEVEGGEGIDPRKLQQFITARRAAVQGCFERAMTRQPGLTGGKVSVRLVLAGGGRGRVGTVSVEEDTLGSAEVTSCMTTLMSRWIFPVDPADDLPLSAPFIFARAP